MRISDWSSDVCSSDLLYDLLYVHGDPRLFRLEDSFPEFAALDGRLHYTGFVTEAEAAVSAARSNGRHGAPGSGEVIVSAGGGAVGAALLRCALAARPLSPLAEPPWRLLIGPPVPAAEFRAIAATAAPGIPVPRAPPAP